MRIVMPKLGLTMTEGTLTRWLKAEGEAVQEEEVLFEFESEKSIMEFEAPADGVLAEILVNEGETVPCGTPVAMLETDSSRPDGATAKRLETEQGQNVEKPARRPATQTQTERRAGAGAVLATPAAKRRARELGLALADLAGRGPEGRIQLADVEAAAAETEAPAVSKTSTPVARRLASDLGVDLAEVSGSGPGGRVVKQDVLEAAPASSPTPEGTPVPTPAADVAYTAEPLAGVRSVIAQRMADSAFTAPHVTLFTEADASALVEARSQLNSELASTVRISYNSLLIAILARILQEHPLMNAYMVGDEIRRYDVINIALAVDTERGLLAPVIRNADQLDLVTIQRTGDRLVERALAGKSLPDDLTGGTFTMTNLGMFDVDGFTPIINQPQAAILGVGRIVSKPVAVENEVVIRQMMSLSLSFDHRIVDGGPAARFLQRVKQLVERPFALLIPSR